MGDWRGETLARMRALIREADPDVVEESKWMKASKEMGTPTWSHDGGICTGESYKSIVKLTFFKGASLKDPAKLFNSSLDGNARRASDFPVQPSQKDGLGRMCKPHWNQYTTALRKAAAAKAADSAPEPVEPREAVETKPRRATDKAKEPVADSVEAATG